MEENFVGYILDALDPDTRRDVEKYLEDHPESRRQVESLRKAIAPLEAARESIEPPPNLTRRTIERVRAATTMVGRAPGRPAALTLHGSAIPIADRPAMPRWSFRRADFLVAASIILCLTLMIPPGIMMARHRYHVTACQDNLRAFHAAFVSYSDRHDGVYPCAVSAPNGARRVAGMVVPVLTNEGYLGENVSIACPAKGRKPAASSYSLRDLDAMSDADFDRCAESLGGCYAYPLGYRDDRGHQPPRRDPQDTHLSAMPLMADRPPNDPGTNPGNSPNHGSGQNVLFADGHAAYFSHRKAGRDGDDIYVNSKGVVGAGTHKHDTVLGSSQARP